MIAKAQTRDGLSQEFESLTSKIGRLGGQPGDIAVWARETIDQAAADRVARRCEDDRDERCCLLGGCDRPVTVTITSTFKRTNSARSRRSARCVRLPSDTH